MSNSSLPTIVSALITVLLTANPAWARGGFAGGAREKSFFGVIVSGFNFVFEFIFGNVIPFVIGILVALATIGVPVALCIWIIKKVYLSVRK